MSRYGGFWVRLGAFLLDGLCLFPFTILFVWLLSTSQQLAVFAAIPYYLVEPAYMVIFHGVRGQSLGKMALGMRVQFVDGRPISWRGTLVRFTPFIVSRICYGVIVVLAILSMTDTAFTTTPFLQKIILIYGERPTWAKMIEHGFGVWVLAEAFAIATTSRKRAIHDFIAGTVVVRTQEAPPVVGSAV